MPDPIFVEGGGLVPAEALEARGIRASGPGGQNVNKVATKIELKVNLEKIQGMDAAGHKRLLRIVAKRIDSGGRLLVTSQRTRDQYRNLQDARKKVHDWIAQALRPPKKRIRTQPSEASTQRRLEAKRHLSMIKQARRTVAPIED